MRKIYLYAMDDPKGKSQWSFIYFDGELEHYVEDVTNEKFGAPDLISSNVSLNSVKDGVHRVRVYGADATAYIWSTKQHVGSDIVKGKYVDVYRIDRHGLVVFPDDKRSVKGAKDKYKKMSPRL